MRLDIDGLMRLGGMTVARSVVVGTPTTGLPLKMVPVSSHLCPSVVEGTQVDECIMLVRLKHTLNFSSYWKVCPYLNI